DLLRRTGGRSEQIVLDRELDEFTDVCLFPDRASLEDRQSRELAARRLLHDLLEGRPIEADDPTLRVECREPETLCVHGVSQSADPIEVDDGRIRHPACAEGPRDGDYPRHAIGGTYK